MATQTHDAFPVLAAAVIRPVGELLVRGFRQEAERFIAAFSLWICSAVEAGEMAGIEADSVFTYLGNYLDERQEPVLSDEVQELLVEGEHLHHAGDPPGGAATPDIAYMRKLAQGILAT